MDKARKLDFIYSHFSRQTKYVSSPSDESLVSVQQTLYTKMNCLKQIHPVDVIHVFNPVLQRNMLILIWSRHE